jgi:hypothetical protein
MKTIRLLLFLLFLPQMTTYGQSTIDPGGNSFAWAANAGWVSCRPSAPDGVVVTGTLLSGYAYAANFGWISFGGGAPSNGHTYSNTTGADCGVNHDGAGNLSGYAYGANIGWLNFGWAAASDPVRPRIDLATGDFAGNVWAANIGWINLGAGYLRTSTITWPDGDGDGIADAWEMQRFGSLAAADAFTDHDRDGASDAAEFVADTDPADPASRLKIVSHAYSADWNRVNLRFSETRPTRFYRIEHSDNLTASWTIAAPGAFPPDNSPLTTRTILFPVGPRRFFRVAPVIPLQP